MQRHPMILTIPRPQAPALPDTGCWSVTDLGFLHPPLWQTRADAEHDERTLQPITYLLLHNAQGHVWCYQRVGGDARLDGRCSCGVGGHVDAADAAPEPATATAPDAVATASADFASAATLHRALLRELAEELQTAPGHPAGEQHIDHLRLRGLIYEGLSAVGRVHLGVLYTAQWLPAAPPQPRAGEKLAGLGFMPLAHVAQDTRFELWSRLAAEHLLSAQP